MMAKRTKKKEKKAMSVIIAAVFLVVLLMGLMFIVQFLPNFFHSQTANVITVLDTFCSRPSTPIEVGGQVYDRQVNVLLKNEGTDPIDATGVRGPPSDAFVSEATMNLPLDDISGGITPDTANPGRTGQVIGAAAVPGMIGKAAEFLDTGQKIAVPFDYASGGFTLLFWFKSTGPQRILSSAPLNIETTANDGLVVRFYYQAVPPQECTTPPNKYKRNQWQHFAVTYNPVSSKLAIFINSLPVGQCSMDPTHQPLPSSAAAYQNMNFGRLSATSEFESAGDPEIPNGPRVSLQGSGTVVTMDNILFLNGVTVSSIPSENTCIPVGPTGSERRCGNIRVTRSDGAPLPFARTEGNSILVHDVQSLLVVGAREGEIVDLAVTGPSNFVTTSAYC